MMEVSLANTLLSLTSTESRGQPRTELALLTSLFSLCLSRSVLPGAQHTARINAVLGRNITLSCRIEVGSNLTLTQSSWERRLPSQYARRVSFVSPSVRDATITLEGVGFDDIGSYTCKVATFPLGNTQASTYVNILVEPKVYVSAGPDALLDGANESLVATCIAEKGRPAAEVFWEAELNGRSERQAQEEADGTTSVNMRYLWSPLSRAQGRILTCVVRHPALQTDFRIPFTLNVHFAPVVSIEGLSESWYVGQENVKFDCGARANPPPRYFTWIRLDGQMPDGVRINNSTFAFGRALERNDSGVYRCEVTNDIGLRSRDVNLWVQALISLLPPNDPPSATTSEIGSFHITNTLLAEEFPLGLIKLYALGTIVGGAVGGVLFLVLLLILGVACYMRKRRTFRGDYYTKQYLGPSDMQKEAQLDVLQPHELQEVYGDKTSKGSQDLKPKLGSDIIYPEYTERDEWADRGDKQRSLKDADYYANHYNNGQNVHPYDNGTESDYVSHLDGSVISRREWYV
uniref:Nectin cell adhesion molecule 3 n=1 Tax=Neogobius melanostomus TaxID=47308 RepID=A0A8C6WK95_9GOBI